MNNNVVITGMGILSPIATGKDSFWKGLSQGKTGFREITLFNTDAYNVRLAGELADFDPLPFLGKKGLRDLDRSTRLICSAAKLAIDDARLDISDHNTHETGVSIGTTFGSLHSVLSFDRLGLIEGPRFVNPSHFPNTVINSPASQVSIRYKIKGFNTTISTGFCASLDAVAYAADFIHFNRANVVLAGGVEELCEDTFWGFQKLGLLSGIDGTPPVCRPFDARRNGIIFAEGAAILVLENEQYAIRRGASILAKIVGYGNAFDPAQTIDFNASGQGLQEAIEEALREASLKPGDIDCICSCANSTLGLDRMETRVIKNIFGNHAYKTPVTAIKSMIGETFSASGAFALAASVGMIQDGIVPPTVNFREKDPDCDLDYVPNSARKKQVRNVLVTSADPYGQNSATILGNYTG